MGNVLSAGLGQAPARQAALLAGLPPTIAAVTVNKVCGSGLKSVMMAAQAIRCGDAQAIVAGGMESMSSAPHFARRLRTGQKLGDLTLVDGMISDGLTCAMDHCHMGMHAEYTAKTWDVTREQQDEFAAESQRRAAAAWEQGLFDDEIAKVTVSSRKGDTIVEADECVRSGTTVDSLAGLRPAFDKEGSVTAGNASTLSDGAAAVVVTNAELADECNSGVKAKILAYHTSGGEPRDLFVAPVAAIQGALGKASLTSEDIDVFEINEAFAAQMLSEATKTRP
jgi:acetyl-CoA C-acetyltransferase